MKKHWWIAALVVVCLSFFYKTILLGKIPFPGDLLLTQYAPWRHVSYDGYVAGSIPSKDQYFDVLRELYPWKTLVIDQLKKGEFPLWNPYNFSGSPLLANHQSQVFYPFTFLYFLFPQITAWTIMVILQPILGSLFMYLFATEIGLSAAAALLASILFNFSGFANVWMEFTTVWHTILWLPLLLYLFERGIKQKKLTIKEQIVFMFGLFSSMTAGHPQDFINSFIFLIVYILIRFVSLHNWSWKDKKSFILSPILPILAFPFFLGAVQLLPTIELYLNSARVTHEYQQIITKMLVQWWQIPLLAVSDFFGNPATRSNFTGDYVGKTLSIGVGGLFLAIIATTTRIQSWHKKFFLGCATVILLLTTRTPITELFYTYPLPVLSTGTPTRILFLLMLSTSILAGFGFEAVIKRTANLKKSFILSWIIFLSLWAFVLIRPAVPGLIYQSNSAATMKRAMLLATAILGTSSVLTILSFRIKKVWLLIAVVCIGELLYSFVKFNPFVPKTFIYPPNPLISFLQEVTEINRFWGYGTGGIEANFATQENIYSPDGTDPLNLKWYNQLIQSGYDGNLARTFSRSTRSDATLAPGYGETDLPSNTYRLRLMDVLGIKYVIDRSENPKNADTFPRDRFKEIWRKDDWIVYENIKSAPRAFVTSDVRSYKDSADFEKQFFSNTFYPEKTILIQLLDWHTIGPLEGRIGSSQLISYTPNRVELSVYSDGTTVLFLSDTFDNGWTATVNGKPATIYRANYTFRAVKVPKGQSHVQFVYRPRSFMTGAAISIIGLFFVIVYVILWKIRRQETLTV
jgi:hypothetical protein